MVIDFHTHTYPDKIADRTVAFLAEKGSVTPYRAGTYDSLVESMQADGIDYSVSLPVVTKPSQTESINRLSVEMNGKNNVFFAGGIHPDCDNVEEILDKVKEAGLFGIKIHPDYQGVYFDDLRYIRILKAAAERDLITVTHAGMDVGFRNDIHCTPDMILNVFDKLSGIIDNKLVLAHMGSFANTEETLEKLCGLPVYMDTAVMLEEQFLEGSLAIIRKHGADRILFATDSPWAKQGEYADVIRSLDLSADEKELILHKNAEKLLHFNA